MPRAHHFESFTGEPLGAVVSLCCKTASRWRTGLFAAPRASPERTGLYVATSNAGTASSLEFWGEARRCGVGLASPELLVGGSSSEVSHAATS